ncbi:hypothetical protein NE237_013951 [Protea cynaroides]|uniref:F-box domain-containing protein n=1 Tax=Protea cynaroides TaxID=273540 RepID=A0A9Q0K0M7_9MAGN|nr:hypothetical protein NE237_013951 [Protea cynaroides]
MLSFNETELGGIEDDSLIPFGENLESISRLLDNSSFYGTASYQISNALWGTLKDLKLEVLIGVSMEDLFGADEPIRSKYLAFEIFGTKTANPSNLVLAVNSIYVSGQAKDWHKSVVREGGDGRREDDGASLLLPQHKNTPRTIILSFSTVGFCYNLKLVSHLALQLREAEYIEEGIGEAEVLRRGGRDRGEILQWDCGPVAAASLLLASTMGDKRPRSVSSPDLYLDVLHQYFSGGSRDLQTDQRAEEGIKEDDGGSKVAEMESIEAAMECDGGTKSGGGPTDGDITSNTKTDVPAMKEVVDPTGDFKNMAESLSHCITMELLEHEPECSTDMTENHAPLIRGLPDDIAIFCIARVPRRYHMILKSVSKRWRELVCSEEWSSYRKKHNVEETWIYAICRDKSDLIHCYVLDPNSSRRCWKLVQGLPPRCLKRKGLASEVLGKKLYLLGGCSWSEDASHDVYCYDASKNTWDEAASLSTARCYFACEALNEKLYAVGGVTSSSSDPCSWDTYDPSTSSCMTLLDPNIFPDIQESVVLDGKIYIRGAVSTMSQHIPALVYEPTSSEWQHVDEDLVLGWHGPAVVVDSTLYVLDQRSGTRLMMWQAKSRDWVSVGRLSPLLTRPPCRLVAIGKSIFVIGKGLSTVVLDLAKAGNVGGVMVSSSVPKLDSDVDVISCKTLSI